MSKDDGKEGIVVREPAVVISLTYFPQQLRLEMQATTSDAVLLRGMLAEAESLVNRSQAEKAVGSIVSAPPGVKL